jgi:hypothetical protein
MYPDVIAPNIVVVGTQNASVQGVSKGVTTCYFMVRRTVQFKRIYEDVF